MPKQNLSKATSAANRAAQTELRNMLEEATLRQEELANPQSNDLLNMVLKEKRMMTDDGKMAVEYSNNVNATDVRFLGRVAEIGVKKGKRLPTYFQPYRLDEFCKRLAAKMVPDGLDAAFEQDRAWSQRDVSLRMLDIFRPVPNQSFMMGPFAYEKPQRKKPAQRKPRAALEEAVRPSEAAPTTAEQGFEQTVKELHAGLLKGKLQGKAQSDFFQAMLNPKSFGQTVENIFSASFLVKDGLAEIKSVDGIPVIEAREGRGDISKLTRKQAVITLNYKTFLEMRNNLPTEDSQVRDRSKDYEELNKRRKAAFGSRQSGAEEDEEDEEPAESASRPPPIEEEEVPMTQKRSKRRLVMEDEDG